ncbi:MAG: hypothetical protein ABIS68_11640 [Casimicrobiaceae bacterium]
MHLNIVGVSSTLFAAIALIPSICAGLGAFPTKLVGPISSTVGNPAKQGLAVGLSADGTTAIVGAPTELTIGAAIVYVLIGPSWQFQARLNGLTVDTRSNQGSSVALSADGNTAIVGGYSDDADAMAFAAGAVWVFTRDGGGVWTQQGEKLRGNDGINASAQGWAAALSADGNTAIVGGPGDNSNQGAAWIYTRTSGVWTQQGPKLLGTSVPGVPRQGIAVALSADGNTAIVGGSGDNGSVGAAWIYTRSNGLWAQQGAKLVGSEFVGTPEQGISVALSGDGNTAIVGGRSDADPVGAAWVYTRTGGVWSQQGNKLIGTGATGGANQGRSVALSGDGNTALVGGPNDNSGVGAAWLFTRTGGIWSQQGAKRVGNLAFQTSAQGSSVALSSDASVALIGGPGDFSQNGAAWVFASAPCTLDVDGNNAIDALTDGLILIRAMFGLTGTSVTNGAIGGGTPTRATWAQIQPYLNGNCGTSFAP